MGNDCTDHTALAAAAVAEAVGGPEAVEMLRDRLSGDSVRTIAERYCIPKTTVARRLEVAELRIEQIKARAATLTPNTTLTGPSGGGGGYG